MLTRYLFLLYPSLLTVLLTGCTLESSPRYTDGYVYHNINFGRNLSPTFKYGIRDGCETSRGIYTKSHTLFNNDNDYYNGWFIGRNKCRHLLRIDEEGNLIL